MCANYTPPSVETLAAWAGHPLDLQYDQQAWPGSTVPIVRPDSAGGMRVDVGTFGLVPHWVRSRQDARKSMRRCYNSRSETASSKPSFRSAVKAAHFCAMPVKAYFEPRYPEDGKPVRWRIEPKDGDILFVAGLWSSWKDPENEEELLSSSMLTLSAEEHPLLRLFHAPEDEKRTIGMMRGSEVEAFLHADPTAAITGLRVWTDEELVAQPDPLPPRRS